MSFGADYSFGRHSVKYYPLWDKPLRVIKGKRARSPIPPRYRYLDKYAAR